MATILDHLEGIVAIAAAAVAAISAFVRMEMKLNSITENFRFCQSQRDKNHARFEAEHGVLKHALTNIGEQLQDALVMLAERLARVETKIDDMGDRDGRH
jgi:hypothetical protein